MPLPAQRFVILVTGSSRPDVPPERVTKRLDEIATATGLTGVALTILHGGAEGVDSVADAWAREHGHEVVCVEADWGYGAVGGVIRNRRLLEVLVQAERGGMAVRCEAFPGMSSKGTWQMVELCRGQGLLVTVNV